MAWLFAFTLFVSATLLFLIQPMIGKVIVPRFGGSPAVWNTCMLFFQSALLAAYAYAHLAPGRLVLQTNLHVVLLVLPLLVLPVGWLVWPFAAPPLGLAPDWAPPGAAHPVPWLLLVMALTIGLPFLVLATTAPLLQRWFAGTDRPSARDPYYLYAASNLGSMVALLGYPVLVEPWLGLTAQGWLWIAGYAFCAALVVVCMALLRSAPSAPPLPEVAAEATPAAVPDAELATAIQAEAPVPATAVTAERPPALLMPVAGEPLATELLEQAVTPGQRCLWVARAFVPASLMLGVTTYLTTDLAPMPLLWVVPLALYLLTFIIAFARVPAVLHKVFVLWTPLPVLLLVYLIASDMWMAIGWRFALHLGALFALCLALHGELAQTRPSARHLTEFYLWLALGGVLGGLFNALAAPLLFTRLTEYPLMLAVGCMLLPPLTRGPPIRWRFLADLLLLSALVGSGIVILLVSKGDWPAGPDGNPRFWLWNLPTDGIFWLLVLALLWPAALLLLFFFRDDWLNRVFDLVVPLFVALWIGVHLAIDRCQPKHLVVLLCVDAALLAVLAALVVIHALNRQVVRAFSLFWGAILGMGLGLLVVYTSITARASLAPDPLSSLALRGHEALMYGFPLLLVLLTADRPLRFGLCVGALLLTATLYEDSRSQRHQHVVHRDRSFFGVCAIEESGYSLNGVFTASHRRLLHGTTLHGMQKIDSNEALTYYHSTSPPGEVLESFAKRGWTPPLAVVGLGVGTMASHGKPGQEVAFYEIDPAVIRLARNPNWFTYVTDAEQRGVNLKIHLGDGRLQLANAPDGHYGLILLDAFNSDAIPTHLFTREALQVYLRKLAPGGIIAFHVSNRYLNLKPVLGNLAHDAGLAAIARYDTEDSIPGKNASDWVMLARQRADLADVPDRAGWEDVPPDPNRRLWTDDYCNLLSVYRWE